MCYYEKMDSRTGMTSLLALLVGYFGVVLACFFFWPFVNMWKVPGLLFSIELEAYWMFTQ